MLNEYQNLVPSEKEMKLRVFINQLTNDLYSNEKIEVDSQKLLELLSYLTSSENISKQMKSAVEYQQRKITDILNKKQVEKLKDYIKYLKEHSISVQKVKEIVKEAIEIIESEQFKIIMGDMTKVGRLRWLLEIKLLEDK